MEVKNNSRTNEINTLQHKEFIDIYISIICIGVLTSTTKITTVLYCPQHIEQTIIDNRTVNMYTYQQAELDAVKLTIDKFDNGYTNLTIYSSSNYIKSIIIKYKDIVINKKETDIIYISEKNSKTIKSILYSITNRSINSNWINIKIIDKKDKHIIYARTICLQQI